MSWDRHLPAVGQVEVGQSGERGEPGEAAVGQVPAVAGLQVLQAAQLRAVAQSRVAQLLVALHPGHGMALSAWAQRSRHRPNNTAMGSCAQAKLLQKDVQWDVAEQLGLQPAMHADLCHLLSTDNMQAQSEHWPNPLTALPGGVAWH